MSELKKQIADTINNIQEVVDLFYQQNDKDAFQKFENTILEMTKAIDNLYLYKNENTDFELDDENICKILRETMEALESGDNVLMADILQYDFIEYINTLLEQIE